MSESYDIGPIRPPSEAGSLLIRVSRNCPWNKCEFCNVYKGSKFEKKSVADVKCDIDKAAAFYGRRSSIIETAFLQDANAILMKTSELAEIIRYLRERFPTIKRITTYGRAQTVSRKTVSELKELKEAGLDRIHMGMETGYGPLLDYIQKGATPEQIIDSGRKIREAGISLSEYVMPGLGGKAMSREHAIESARALNAIDPDFIRLRTFTIRRYTPLYDKYEKGELVLLSDVEIAKEIRLFIENLDGITSALVSDHMMNLLQEAQGELPRDKEKLIGVFDRFLALPDEDKTLFQVGARLGWFRELDDMADPSRRAHIIDIISKISAQIASSGGNMTVSDFLREAMMEVI
ncbi:MAG: radical SAM protein [bacterium]